MKKKTVGLLLGCLMAVLSVIVFPGRTAYAADYSSLQEGDIVEFGSYPQKLVTDTDLISNLNSVFKNWRSYPYYSKNTASDAKKHPSAKDTSMMMYSDFSYGGKKYRAVSISKYRPYDTTNPADGEGMGTYGNQASQGYTKGTYYFEYQPIRWIVVNKAQGLLVTEKILDSQPFNAYYYSAEAAFNETQARSHVNNDTSASDYYYSTVRYWLNGVDTYYSNYANFSFIGTAFSTDAQKDAVYTTSFDVVGYDNKTRIAVDRVFLLDKATVNSVISSTGNDFYPTETTDYARAQGVAKTNITWRLRDRYGMSSTYFVKDGQVDESVAGDTNGYITATFVGIRPAIRTNLNSDLVTKTFQIRVNASDSGAPVISWALQGASANYRVYRCSAKADKNNESSWTFLTGLGPGVSSYTDTTAQIGNGYYYRVVMIRNNLATISNHVGFDYRVQAPTLTNCAPDAETGFLRVSWNRSASAYKYYVERRIANGGTWSRVFTCSDDQSAEYEYLDRSTLAGNEYEYRVQATSGTYTEYDSEWSNVKKAKCVPGRPTGMTFSDNTDGMPRVSWTPASVNLCVGYRVRYAAVGSSTWTELFTTSTTAVLTEAVPGTVYNIRVTACMSRTDKSYDSAEVAGKKRCVYAPGFTKTPQDTVTFVGQSDFTITVESTGEGLKYEWYVLRLSNREAGYVLEHTCTDGKWSFTPTAADDGMKFYVVATDKFGRYATPQPAMLMVLSQPTAVRVNVGDEAPFKVTTKYPSYIASYQWQSRKDANSEWSNSGQPGAKTATLKVATTAGLHGWQFRCVVKDKNGNTAVSKPATLKLAPKITKQPKSVYAAPGTKAQFTVAATGKAPLKYQWQSRKNSSAEWTNSGQPGAKTATLKVNATAGLNGWQFRCVVTDANGQNWGSSPATLFTKLGILKQPTNTTASAGSTAKFTVEAYGKATLKYQWQSRKNSSATWTNSAQPGAKTATLSVNTTKGLNGWQFRCVVTDGDGNPLPSKEATLTVK